MANHAIVIGIDRYATDLESLDGAVADAYAFASWLVASGEVAPDCLLLGTWPGASSPSRPASLEKCRAIGTSLSELNTVLNGYLDAAVPDLGRLYFFFSGHGASASNPVYLEEAICLRDYTDDATHLALEISSLLAVLNAVAAEERLVFIDGCRNTVFRDDIQFGRLARKPRPAKGIRRNFVLRATAPGRKAAEVDGRGLFTRHLCEGLQGDGPAKRWDPDANGGDGGYVVRWRSLVDHISDAVATRYRPPRDEQLVFEEGEHPANANPLFATFADGHFPLSTLTVRLVDPATPPQQTQVFLRRNDSTDADRSEEVPGTRMVQFQLPPSSWVLWARTDGWQSLPRSKAVHVYEPSVEEEIRLVRQDMRGPGATFRASAPTLAAAADESRKPGSTSWVELRVGGKPISQVQPSVRVAVRRDSGEVIRDPVQEDVMAMAPGVYRVRLDVGGASWSHVEVPLLVTPGEDALVDLPLPDTGSEALARTLLAGNKPPPQGGFVLPSEAMGPLVGTSVATVASLAVVQSVQGYEYGLASLQVARRWSRGDEAGVEVLVADERRSPADAGPRRARLWHMRVPETRPVSGELLASRADVPVTSTSLALSPGGYWLQLRDADRQRRAGFKLATQVLPGHVTLVVRNPTPSGEVVLLQFAIRRDPAHRIDLQAGVVNGEALQRARAAGRDPLADPVLLELAEGRWFEPFSAFVAASALLDRGEEGHDAFRKILAALSAREIGGADAAVLQAALAAMNGRDEEAALHITRALSLAQAPIVGSLLERLDGEARRLGIAGPDADWVAGKLHETTGHPLWTLRREDDTRRSGKPDALPGRP